MPVILPLTCKRCGLDFDVRSDERDGMHCPFCRGRLKPRPGARLRDAPAGIADESPPVIENGLMI